MKKIVIIGGGIVGQFVAYYLTKDGHQVTIVDDGPTMPPASVGNCGLITPSHVAPMNSWSVIWTGLKWLRKKDAPLSIKPQLDPMFLKWFIDFVWYARKTSIQNITQARHELLQSSWILYQQFLDQEKVDVNFKHEGLVYIARSKTGLEGIRHEYHSLQQYGLQSRMLSETELIELEPSIKEGILGGSIFNVDGWLDPTQLLLEIKKINQNQGVNHVQGKVDGFDKAARKISSASVGDQKIEADEFILSAGAFSVKLGKTLDLNIPVIPGKGYNLTTNQPLANQPTRPIYLFDKKVVATPWDSGFRLGSTMEFSGFDLSLNQARLDALRKASEEYLKTDLADADFVPWAGFRPMTASGLPIIQRANKFKNLILATGHGMLGLTLAPVTGNLVCKFVKS